MRDWILKAWPLLSKQITKTQTLIIALDILLFSWSDRFFFLYEMTYRKYQILIPITHHSSIGFYRISDFILCALCLSVFMKNNLAQIKVLRTMNIIRLVSVGDYLISMTTASQHESFPRHFNVRAVESIKFLAQHTLRIIESFRITRYICIAETKLFCKLKKMIYRSMDKTTVVC